MRSSPISLTTLVPAAALVFNVAFGPFFGSFRMDRGGMVAAGIFRAVFAVVVVFWVVWGVFVVFSAILVVIAVFFAMVRVLVAVFVWVVF